MYEVELKFPLPDADAVLGRLAACGARLGQPVDQRDWYFNHPVRDFGRTDEAFRIRSVDRSHAVTYKGPLVDSRTKTRREIEIPFAESDAREKFAQILQLLGFRPVREVHKQRRTSRLQWHERGFEIALDAVEGLGQFLEIETIADEDGRPAAQAAVQSLAAHLQLSTPERASYLSLLLEKDGQNS